MWCLIISIGFEYLFLILNIIWLIKGLIQSRKKSQLDKKNGVKTDTKENPNVFYIWVKKRQYEKNPNVIYEDPFNGYDPFTVRHKKERKNVSRPKLNQIAQAPKAMIEENNLQNNLEEGSKKFRGNKRPKELSKREPIEEEVSGKDKNNAKMMSKGP